MKEDTKNRLRKFGKVACYGLGLFAMLLLGVGLGNCSANGKQAKAQAVPASSLAEHKTLQPKRAIDPADFSTLIDDENNLLLNGYAGYFTFSRATDDSGWRVADASRDRNLYLVELGTGTYVFDHFASSNGDVGNYAFLNDYGAQQVLKRFNGEPSQRVILEDADMYNQRFYGIIDSSSSPRQILTMPTGFRWFMVLAKADVGLNTSVAVYDSMKVPALHVITFPNDYNPLSGFGIPNDGLIGQLSGNGSSPFRLNLYFRSGGQLFTRIDFYFLPMLGMEYVSTLNDGGSPSVFSGSGFVYCSVIEFISVDGASFTAWRAIFGSKADGNVYLRNFGEWASKQYQTIEVISYTPVYGQSGVAPNLDQVGILELRTASGVPTPVIGGNSNADVFSLLGVGFQSVAGLLNIQILPFLTLGTLLFVPLVVMIIFAILKVLNK